MEDAQKGLFRPDRERDELWRALGNDEKGGQTGGKGGVPWKNAFPEYVDSYKSRKRAKDREADRIGKLEQELAGVKKIVAKALSQRSSQSREDPPLEYSQRRSSQASTEVHVDDHALLDDAPAPHYPVDDVRGMTQCELHQPMSNMSFKVATASALPCLPGSLHHSRPIPPGYARVTVDELLEGYEDLEIDIATDEGHKKLGDVKHQIVLWQKKYIKFPGSAPRPPTPRNPSRPPSPPPPPMIVDLQVHPLRRNGPAPLPRAPLRRKVALRR